MDTPPPTIPTNNLKATHLRRISFQIKAAQCTAYLSYTNLECNRTVAQLQNNYKVMEA
jgi:hypothetical protein